MEKSEKTQNVQNFIAAHLETVKQFLYTAISAFIKNPSWKAAWQFLEGAGTNPKLVIVVSWRPGFGTAKDPDTIQVGFDLDWGLCASIRLYDQKLDAEDWHHPLTTRSANHDAESIFKVEPIAASPEGSEQLAAQVLKEYNRINKLLNSKKRHSRGSGDDSSAGKINNEKKKGGK